MISFSVERYVDAEADIRRIERTSALEIERETGIPGLVINHDYYRRLNGNGNLEVFIARDDGQVVGFSFYFLTKSLLNGAFWASSELMWVEREFRRPRIASRFVRFITDYFRGKGVSNIRVAAIPGSGFDRLLARGARAVSITYEMRTPDA